LLFIADLKAPQARGRLSSGKKASASTAKKKKAKKGWKAGEASDKFSPLNLVEGAA